jgi:hypothetical protein
VLIHRTSGFLRNHNLHAIRAHDKISVEVKSSSSSSSRKTVALCGSQKELPSPEDIVRQELDEVERISRAKVLKLQNASDVHIGMEIFHLFVLDLLGRTTAAAKIYTTKSDEEFRHSNIVTNLSKILAWTMVVLLNLFFVFYTLMKSTNRDQAWQQGLVIACALQLVVEVVIFETTETVYVHYIIPRLASGEVMESLECLRKSVANAFSERQRPSGMLDAPKFFFVSTHVARQFPSLFESTIVQSFHDIYPTRVAERWAYVEPVQRSLPGGSTIRNGMYSLYRLVKRGVIFFTSFRLLQYIGTTPVRMQKAILHTLQPIMVSFLFMIIYTILSHPWLASIPPMIFLVYHCLRWLKKEKGKMKTKTKFGMVTPLSCNSENMDADEDEGDREGAGEDEDLGEGFEEDDEGFRMRLLAELQDDIERAEAEGSLSSGQLDDDMSVEDDASSDTDSSEGMHARVYGAAALSISMSMGTDGVDEGEGGDDDSSFVSSDNTSYAATVLDWIAQQESAAKLGWSDDGSGSGSSSGDGDGSGSDSVIEVRGPDIVEWPGSDSSESHSKEEEEEGGKFDMGELMARWLDKDSASGSGGSRSRDMDII